MPSNHRGSIVLVFIMLLLPSQAVAAEPQLVFSAIAGSFNGKLGEAILIEAYGRLGIRIGTEPQKAASALRLSSSGRTDGEVQRIHRIGSIYPTLRRVEEPLFSIDGVVFSKNYDFAVKGPESLKHLVVGIVGGIKYAEQVSQGLNVVKVSKPEQLFQLLELGRIDVAILGRLSGMLYLRNNGIKKIKILEPPLVSRKLFHYLHEKHGHLIAAVEGALRAMKADGSLSKIVEDTARQLSAD
jgi:polar amino acid transport system substrate-binding protein